MKIFFCDLCNESVPQNHLDEGLAFLRKGRVVCATCDKLMTAQEESGSGGPFDGAAAGPTVGGGGTATLARPATATPTGVAAGMAPGSSPGSSSGGPPRELLRPDLAPRTSSSGAWLAVVTLIFAAAAFALLVERITALETTMLREDRALAGDLRVVLSEVDATLAAVGGQGRELELRLSDRIDASRQQTDAVLRELSAELADSRREVARLSETIERQSAELARERADAVRRNDDLTGRLARSEEDLRYYSQRLSDLEMASLRPITAAGVPAAGAPAWQGLLADLASPLAGTRWQAVDALGQTNDLAVVEHLVPVLKDPDVFVRMAGARALEALGAVDATPALIDALEDPEAAVREAAIVALKKLTGRDFRFDPLANDAERAKRIKSWREWWKKEGAGGE